MISQADIEKETLTMSFQSVLNSLKFATVRTRARRARRGAPRKRPATWKLLLELLEDRTVPSTLTVTNNLDTGGSGDGSLRGEIAVAQSGDTINFDPSLAGQTIALTSGELAISKSLDIEGLGADQLTISGNNASRVFNISGSATNVEIANLTIADGLATGTTVAAGTFGPVTLGGGILNTGAHVTLFGVTLADNQALADQVGYVQTNLVSDLASENAQLTDPNLKNPWGTSFSDTGFFSISDQQTNVNTLYSLAAAGVSQAPPTIAIPTTAAGPQGPTGQVNNDTSSFLVNGTPASRIFADLNGTLSAWNSSAGTTAQVEATTTGAAYSGLDSGSNASGDFLYAANPKQGRIDVFDGSFVLTSLGPNAFHDPLLPAGLVPFNVDNINGDLYVMYAPAGPPTARNMALEGHGAVAVFDTSGNFIRQLTSGGKLASPWGITLAPSTFGKFRGDLLVGNFSFAAGEINAFDPVSGRYLGTLTDSSGNTLLNHAQGLWYLTFGIGGNGGDPNTLYFTSGLNAETDGLIGAIDPLSSIAEGGAVANVSGATLEVLHGTFTNNKSTGAIQGRAGALANDLGSTLVLDHSTFSGNEAITLLGAGLLPIQGNALGGALINLSGSQATVSHTTFEGNSAHGGNGADGGPGQNGGNAGTGAGGAVTNDGGSLLGPFAPSTMTVEDSLFIGNQAIGGTGGNGGAGGNGGNGSGLGVGAGAINNGSSTLTVSDSTFLGNQVIGGNGGSGGAGRNGGAGSAARGGAISSVPTPFFGSGLPPVRATLHVEGSLFLGNEALGGAGGNGGSGGNGGAGGAGQGGALRLVLTDWDVSHSLFILNQATGGAGGDQGSGGLLGGNGGAGQGGAIINVNGSIGTVSESVFVLNAATGGAGGVGGNGGNGQGGGVFNDGASSATFQRSRIVNNEADGGAAGAGGSDGQGVGGGLYLTPGGVACADLLTVIRANHASTSDDDVFGVLGVC
jgi:uncharacterized protein (TIGR03118 family)